VLNGHLAVIWATLTALRCVTRHTPRRARPTSARHVVHDVTYRQVGRRPRWGLLGAVARLQRSRAEASRDARRETARSAPSAVPSGQGPAGPGPGGGPGRSRTSRATRRGPSGRHREARQRELLAACRSWARPLAAAFSQDGRTLATSDIFGSQAKVTLWDVSDSGHPARRQPPLAAGGSAGVTAAAYSADGRTLALGRSDGTTGLWRLARPARAVRIGAPLAARRIPTATPMR
jgi:hypothetical protein